MGGLVEKHDIGYEEFQRRLELLNYKKLVNKALKTTKLCFKDDSHCSKRIIKAHSIQNTGILKPISNNGMVLTLNTMTTNPVIQNSDVPLIQTGRKVATIFHGFCKYHDAKIFTPIESRPYISSKEQHFLYAYRAFARWFTTTRLIHQIQIEVKNYIRLNNDRQLFPVLPRNVLDTAEKYDNEVLQAVENAMPRYWDLRDVMNRCLDNRDFDEINTDEIVFDSEYPLAVNDIFHIATDIQKNNVSKNVITDSQYSDLYVNIFPKDGKTHVLLSYHAKDKKKYSFIKEQILQEPIEKQKIILSNMLAIYSNNIVISPGWWKDITNEIEEHELFRQLKQLRKQGAYNRELVLEPGLNIFM